MLHKLHSIVLIHKLFFNSKQLMTYPLTWMYSQPSVILGYAYRD
jgi:hypothetical protein